MPDTWAKTSVTSVVAWEDALQIDQQAATILTETAQVASLTVGALGGSASIVNGGGPYSPATKYAGVLKTSNTPPTPSIYTLYFPFVVTVSAPGMGNSESSGVVWVSGGDVAFNFPNVPPAMPGGATLVSSLSVPVTCTVTGLTLCKKRTDGTNVTRNVPWDWSDQTVAHTWYAEEDATVTVSAYGLEVTGALAGAGAEVDLGTGFNWYATLVNNHFAAANTSYGRHASAECFGIPLDYDVTLYKPGTGDAPSSAYPDQKRAAPSSGAYLTLVNDGGIALQRSASVAPSAGTTYSMGVAVTAPVKLNYIGSLARKWNPDGASYGDLKVIAEPRDWVDGAWVPHEWAFGADYSQTQFPRSWLFEYEYRFLSDGGTIQVTTASREAEGENVGGSSIAENDQQLAILSQPLSGGVTGDPLWPMVGISHLTSLDLNDPADAPSRPSLWEAISGVSVDAGDNDSWTVSAGASGPSVRRTLATRYWLRLGNLQGYNNDPGLERNFDWPIVLRPNQHLTEDLGDAAAWETAVPYEDEWHAAQFNRASLGLTAPKAGTVTLTVAYSTVSVDDPCYSSVEWRADEWAYSRTQHTATYTVDVSSGAGTYLIDLACPNENFLPVGDLRMMHVDSITFTLPDGGASPEAWHLDSLELVLAPTDSYVHTHNKREWMWPSRKSMGFGAVVDGLPALDLIGCYGYDHHRNERGLTYIQLAQHDPDSEATDDPSYAKVLSRLLTEIGWQRGWTVDWDAPDESSYNQDADGIQFAPELYWWDLEHQHEDSRNGAVAAGTWHWAYGAEYDVYYTGYPQGKLHGLVKNTAGTARICSTSGVATIPGVGSYGTDAQGRWVSGPLKELGGPYAVGPNNFTVVNREYTLANVNKGTHKQPDNAEGYVTDKHTAFADADDGRIYLQRSPSAGSPWEAPRYVSDGTHPWVEVKPQGDLILCKQSGANILWQQSRDGGFTWQGVGAPVTGQYPVAAEFNGIQYLVSFTSGVGQIIRRSQTYFSTLLTYGSGVSSALITANSDAERAAFLKAESDANALCVVVPYSGDLTVYRSVNDGETWTS
jgi:hypothetical protein